ncbi:uncharacterized protein [Nicotiana sylvestris]|uniref:uncharacterized protein n=1 Tax=Nicotiana sylvestris TaxID=4096 RepID=UPI00388CBCFB
MHKTLRVMRATETERVKLDAYHLKGVAYSWFELWEDSREEGNPPMRWSEFVDAFIDHFLLAEPNAVLAAKFENLTQARRNVWEYHMEFSYVSKYAIHMLPTMEARVRRFVQGLNPLTINEASTAAWNYDMNYGKMVAFSQAIENCKLKNKMEREGNRKTRSTSNMEASPDVVTGILTVQSHDVYALIDTSSTLSYVTPFVAMEFGIELDELHEPFSLSTPVDELPGIPPDREIDFGIDVMPDSNEGGVTVQNRAESSLVADVKDKHFNDPLLAQLKEGIHKHKTTAFSFGMNDGTLQYQDRLCVLDIDGLQERIMAEAHTSRYSVHPGSTKMFHDLREVYWWNDMKRDVADFVARCPNCQ